MSAKTKPTNLILKSITGDKDPVRLIEDFIHDLGFDSEECLNIRSAETCRWVVPLNDEVQLELLLENIKQVFGTILYMGVNISTVPLKDTQNFLIQALETADSLIGVKVSVVGHFLVLSSTANLHDKNISDINYQMTELLQQSAWFQSALTGNE